MLARGTWLWLCVAAAGAVAAWVWWSRSSAPEQRRVGFREYVSDPEVKAAVEASFAAAMRDRQRAASWTDDQVAAVVARYVLELTHSEDDDNDLEGKLAAQPERAAEHARRLLAEPSLQQRLHHAVRRRGKQDGLLESPAQRACELIGNHALPAAIPVLVPLLQLPHDGTRKAAALALGRTGDPAAIEGLRQALADADEYVRSYAMTGLQRAGDAGQLAAATRDGLVIPLLDAAMKHDDDRTAALAAKWNAPACLARFRDAGALRAGASPRAMRMALRALNHSGTLLPRDEVLGLWRDRPRGEQWPEPGCRASIVSMLAKHGDPADDPLLQELLLASEDEAEVAASASMRRLGLGGLDQRLREKRFELRAALSPAERRHVAMWDLDVEVKNGGFDQFFVNSSGDDWEAALEGLTAFDPPRAELLREATARFPQPPDRRNRERCEQLAKLNQERERPFDDLDRRYYALQHPIDVAQARHAAAHQQELRGR